LKQQVFHLIRSALLGSAHNVQRHDPGGWKATLPWLTGPLAASCFCKVGKWGQENGVSVQILTEFTCSLFLRHATESAPRIFRCYYQVMARGKRRIGIIKDPTKPE